ncbi:MAG: hypothetical protein ACPGED_00520 [Flavobacteriales bacterium]
MPNIRAYRADQLYFSSIKNQIEMFLVRIGGFEAAFLCYSNHRESRA